VNRGTGRDRFTRFDNGRFGNGYALPAHCMIKPGKGVPLERKESLFIWEKTKTNTENLFFVREILAITSISIHETGDLETIRFELKVPHVGYRIE
jgi:hypothetical protein